MPPLVKLSDNLFEEEALFIAGHSLVMGNLPSKLDLPKVDTKLRENGGITMANLGLFDSSAPNYTTYYPDVTIEDLTPKDSDFIYPVYRMLSQTVVNADSYPIDFSKPGVLRDSMSLLLGVTINADHETSIGNALGSVAEVFWQNSYTDPISGDKVPAGINGKFKIDGKSNPRLARAIMMDPPAIHSNSVTVTFQWVKSHPGLTDEQFWYKWGELDDKGELIRKIATKVRMYRETSLVSLGADPFAQKVKDGKILDAGRGKRQYQNLSASSGGTEAIDLSYVMDWKNTESFHDIDTTKFNYTGNNPKNINNNPTDMEFKDYLVALGFKEDQFADAAALKAHIDGLKTSADSVQGFNDKITQLEAKMPSEEVLTVLNKEGVKEFLLSKDFDSYKDKSANFDSLRQEIVDETVATLKLLKGEAATPAMIAAIQGASLEALQGFNKTYKADLELASPLTCKKCGGTEINRASAKKHGKGDQNDPPEEASYEDVEKNIRGTRRMNALKDFAGTTEPQK